MNGVTYNAPIIVNPTCPISGNGWGFVAICQHNLSPGLGHLSTNFHYYFLESLYKIIGDLLHEIVPKGWGISKTTLANPHESPYTCARPRVGDPMVNFP